MAKKPKTPNTLRSTRGRTSGSGKPGGGPANNNVSNWDYNTARQKEHIKNLQSKRKRYDEKTKAKYGSEKSRARRDKIAAVSSNFAQATAAITGNVQGVEAQETERQRIKAQTAYQYANLINAAQGQTGNADTGASDENPNPQPNNNSNPANGQPSDFGW